MTSPYLPKFPPISAKFSLICRSPSYNFVQKIIDPELYTILPSLQCLLFPAHPFLQNSDQYHIPPPSIAERCSKNTIPTTTAGWSLVQGVSSMASLQTEGLVSQRTFRRTEKTFFPLLVGENSRTAGPGGRQFRPCLVSTWFDFLPFIVSYSHSHFHSSPRDFRPTTTRAYPLQSLLGPTPSTWSPGRSRRSWKGCCIFIVGPGRGTCVLHSFWWLFIVFICVRFLFTLS
jgi:hypothetical protein